MSGRWGSFLKYRPEIDGLRALAVFPVVFFHAGFDLFRGGYIGVDVFFVISGYLITSLILNEASNGTFSLVSFYERRARRILPALFVVLLACIPFSFMWMLPSDLKAFSSSLVSVVLFASNFLFYSQSGYFDQAVELKPLIHTWSLAVEEQFYIIFPIALILLLRYKNKYLMPAFLLVFALSLAAAQIGGNFGSRSILDPQWSWENPPSWGFYLLPTRMWELLLGSMIAYYQIRRAPASPTTKSYFLDIGSLVGLALIALSVFVFDRNTPFPSVYTLLPTIGTALVILFARQGTLSQRLLSNSVFVGLGLISYSFYLWHQPLFAFARIRSLHEPNRATLVTLIVVALILAYLTWRLVEQPFRNRRFVDAKTISIGFVTSACALFAVGLAGYLSHGFPSRIPEDLKIYEEAINDRNPRLQECTFSDVRAACTYGKGRPTVALIGDSHASTLVFELGNALEKKQTAVLGLDIQGCLPVRDLMRVRVREKTPCEGQNEVFDRLRELDEIKYVVMAGRWAMWAEGTQFNNREGGKQTHGGRVKFVIGKDKKTKLGEAIASAVNELLSLNKVVVLVYPIPEVGWDVPKYMFWLRRFGTLNDDVSTSYSVFLERTRRAREYLDNLGTHPNLIRIYPERIFCDGAKKQRCIASADLKPLYYDGNHLDNAGASLVVAEILKALSPRM